MTIITVTAPEGRLSVDARRELAVTLTDAVLVPEVGASDKPGAIQSLVSCCRPHGHEVRLHALAARSPWG